MRMSRFNVLIGDSWVRSTITFGGYAATRRGKPLRDLGHHGDDPRVVGRDRDDVRPTQGVAPQRHPVGVHVVTAANPADGGGELPGLSGEVEALAARAAALPGGAVVEDQGGDAAAGK